MSQSGETTSSIPIGQAGDALRDEAAQYPSWRAMHGSADEHGTVADQGEVSPAVSLSVGNDAALGIGAQACVIIEMERDNEI